jgi:proteasome accessory factor B
VVQFDYLKSGSVAAERRTLEPWGVLSWRRRWYVVGRDRDREEARSFRLSRIFGEVVTQGDPGSYQRPAELDLLSHVAGRNPDESRVAHVRVHGTGAGRLRRLAFEDTDGVLSISFADLSVLAGQVASAGVSAVAVDPPELVDAVLARLTAVAGRP